MAEKKRELPIPEYKIKKVNELVEKIKKSKTVLIASTKGLPASQFQKIVKALRGKAEVTVVKKSLIIRAIGKIEKGAVQNLKKEIGADVCLMFSELDAFDLSGILSDSLSPTKAKAGDIAPEDVTVEPGPTDLVPGPAISELGAVGLKIAVENGKLAIKKGATIVKEGEEIDEKVAGVMAKLGIEPMKVGFIPLAAYDAEADKVYVGIKIDKEGALVSLQEAIGKALGFAVDVGYVCSGTIGVFIARVGAEGKALEGKVGGGKVKEEEKKEGDDGNEKTEAGGDEVKDGEAKEGEAQPSEGGAESESGAEGEEKKEEVKEESKPEEKKKDE